MATKNNLYSAFVEQQKETAGGWQEEVFNLVTSKRNSYSSLMMLLSMPEEKLKGSTMLK